MPHPASDHSSHPTPSSGPWALDDDLGHRLRAAVQTLLDSLPSAMDDMELRFSDALVGGGGVVCDLPNSTRPGLH
ncbi:hypothetical protein [Streptomyces sp. NPDC048637]|uniref:hypothetical protein n=1 Tax=Streptomyces sp. NPDC048637 TaxID=3155636 RepID=UPI0034139A14